MIILSEEERFSEGWSAPTLTLEEASTVYGYEIPNSAWNGVRIAFGNYSYAMQERAELRAVKGNSRPESWFRAHEATLKSLNAAIAQTCKAQEETKLWESQELIEEKEKLEAVFWNLIDVRRAITDLPVPESDAPSKAEATKTLAKAIRKALESEKLDVRLTGGSIRQSRGNELTAEELKPFEKLCLAFGLGRRGQQPLAFVDWLKEAVSEK